jgi:3-keto-5-aminohexanoate cleavage enzyme
MSKPCIICVALNGAVAKKADNPAVPISIEEEVEAAQEAFEVGATIAHCHVRNEDETPSSDPEKFARLKEGLEKHAVAASGHGVFDDRIEQLSGPGL